MDTINNPNDNFNAKQFFVQRIKQNCKTLYKQFFLISHEHREILPSDLMNASTFRILQNNGIIVIYIKYPFIKAGCKLFKCRAISHTDGKLQIDNKIAGCNETYGNLKNCKLELSNIFCEADITESCLSRLLNREDSNCTKIRERNSELELLNDGVILLSGSHVVNNVSITGTYLVTFKKEVVIDNRTYNNPTEKIWEFLRHNYENTYNVEKYIESPDLKIKFDNIKISPFQIEVESHPMIWTCFILGIIAFISSLIWKSFQMWR